MSKTTKKQEWCPEYKYESVSGKFTDYRGQVRDYTMVAVSIPMSGMVTSIKDVDIPYELPASVKYDENTGERYEVPAKTIWYSDIEETPVSGITKMLSVGIAVRCVRDEDNGLGERIAYGKAVKLQNHVLFTSHPGMINTKMVKAFLEQEAEHFEKDPGSYIASYNNDKFNYMKTGKIAQAELTTDEVKRLESSQYKSITYEYNDKDIPVKKRMQNEASSL